MTFEEARSAALRGYTRWVAGMGEGQLSTERRDELISMIAEEIENAAGRGAMPIEEEARRLVSSEIRLLRFLAEVNGWIREENLPFVSMLKSGDEKLSPGLVERGLIDHLPMSGMIRVSDRGRLVIGSLTVQGFLARHPAA